MEELSVVRLTLENDGVQKDTDVLTSAQCVSFSDGDTFQQKYDSGVLKGEKGDKGDPGSQGPKGDRGDIGPRGDMGPMGYQGPKGDKGDQGCQGPRGDAGPAGLQGIKGDKGEKGDIGAVGPQGVQGPKGDKGDIGPAGPKGEKGDAGPMGNYSNPNLLINGDFQVWQRGERFVDRENLWGIGYTADRWRGRFQPIICERVDNTSPAACKNAMRVTSKPDLESFNIIEQPIENYEIYRGKTITLSCYVKPVNSLTHIGCTIFDKQYVFPISADKWTYVEMTVKVALDNTANLVGFSTWPDEGGYGNGFEVAAAKLEIGEKATPFIPRQYSEELALCQRYYQDESKFRRSAWGEVFTYTGGVPVFQLFRPMRIAPKIKISGNNFTTEGNVMEWGESATAPAEAENSAVAGFNLRLADPTYNKIYTFDWRADAEIY